MNWNAFDARAACTRQRDARSILSRAASVSRASSRDALGRLQRSAGWSVGFVRVMQLDDLDGLEVARSLFREARGEHGADRKVRRDQHADVGPLREPTAN